MARLLLGNQCFCLVTLLTGFRSQSHKLMSLGNQEREVPYRPEARHRVISPFLVFFFTVSLLILPLCLYHISFCISFCSVITFLSVLFLLCLSFLSVFFHPYFRLWNITASFVNPSLLSVFMWFTVFRFLRVSFSTFRKEPVKFKCKVKVNLCLCLTKHYAMKAYWGSGGISPRILWPLH